MQKSLLLKNGKAVIDGKVVKKDILISDGIISQIGVGIKDKKAEVIDCLGKVILPGMIDAHVHFREPGLTHKEDFFTGSCAAAAGGITTVIDMPNTLPPTLTVSDLNEKRIFAASKSVVNYGFHFGSSVDNVSQIKKVRNVASTKIFMNHSTGNMKIEDDSKLADIFSASRMVTVHAEGETVEKAVSIAKKTGTRLYLCHISAASEVEYLKKAKTGKIYIEVTPHHLFLTEVAGNAFYSVKPCLKTQKDIDALWKVINTGFVDTIGTDHAPHTITEKKSAAPPSGMPGDETALALLLDASNKGKIKIEKIVQLFSENPAKIFGINAKGKIKEGYDADITIVDLKLKKKVEGAKFFTKCKWSSYEGMVLKGWPVITIVNGNVVFLDGKINSKFKGREVAFVDE